MIDLAPSHLGSPNAVAHAGSASVGIGKGEDVHEIPHMEEALSQDADILWLRSVIDLELRHSERKGGRQQGFRETGIRG